jgi:CRP/FNR family cyclic AMP-dependent transcriptional regulator
MRERGSKSGARSEAAAVRAGADAAIAKSAIFEDLDGASRSRLVGVLRAVELPSERVLFRSGEPGDSCYLVERGVLRVAIEDRNGIETWLAVLGDGDVVGELCLIDRLPRSANVTSMTDCRLWQLRARDFDLLARDDGSVYRAVARLISRRLRITNQQVCDQRLGLEARLALVMLRLADAFGEPLSDGRTLIRHPIRQVRLAEAAAASRENVSRQFKVWRESGLCEKIGRYYCIGPASAWEELRCGGVAIISG